MAKMIVALLMMTALSAQASEKKSYREMYEAANMTPSEMSADLLRGVAYECRPSASGKVSNCNEFITLFRETCPKTLGRDELSCEVILGNALTAAKNNPRT